MRGVNGTAAARVIYMLNGPYLDRPPVLAGHPDDVPNVVSLERNPSVISEIIRNIALGSVIATPRVDSATVDFISLLPAQSIQNVAGFFSPLGS